MFDLNPLGQPDAWWQHLVMLAVAALIGHIIGYRTSRGIAVQLEAELAELDDLLDSCQQATKLPGKPSITSVSDEPAFIAPEPLDMIPVPASRVSNPAGVPQNTPVAHDDLKIVEGIGPKIEELLNKEGILTLVHLSEASHERLTDILRAAGKRFQMHDPGSWPRQAELAATGKWEELRAWQEELHKGRTT
ncbi:hypothetical protein [Salmonirosea aquatica]|uniref:DUF4332 domain-containing protein n=1 Tax=Salmonirosea aquatica TaxID=2654236 RepID=A0A7C9BFV6_9BACT|nr:hypothetical protein [Cytophagaceae bacterium SJW1-29]